MLLGYNTNGFAFHEPLSAVDLIAEIGYRSAAVTLDVNVLNPYEPRLEHRIDRMRDRLEQRRLRSVVETGARFLLDSRVKHEPTLMSTDADARARRVDFLCRAVEVAHGLGSDAVSLWSGRLREPLPSDAAWARLEDGLRVVLDLADQHGVRVAFEPEPGMFVATLGDYQRLRSRVDAPHLCLTMDVGHLHCLGETPIAAQIRRWHGQIANVHIEDMRSGVHEHLMFGEGEIDFPPVLRAFREVGYEGPLHVELSRHSHEAPEAACRAFEFLQPMLSSDAAPDHEDRP
jgi:sugar phosphate isomerase/epimerase